MSDSVIESKRMKLFVAGEVSGNPDDWKTHHVFVIAETPEQARELVDFTSIISEVPMDCPLLLV